MNNLTFGQRIVAYRSEREMLQKELANNVGISPTALNYYEKDKREPNVMTITKIAEALNVSADDLLGVTSANQSIVLTLLEQAHIKKYRALDERGKNNVDAILESEYSQISVDNTM